MSPKLRSMLSGTEPADSIASEFHKWMFMLYAVGCVLERAAILMPRRRTTPRCRAEGLDPH